MRVQGWISFDSIRCLRGSKCAYFYFSSLVILSITWWCMIIFFLIKSLLDSSKSAVTLWLVLIGVLELILVLVLMVFGYIVSTDIEENEDPMTNPKLKVIKMSYSR